MSRNLRHVKAVVIGAPSVVDAAAYVKTKLNQTGMRTDGDVATADFLWVVMPDRWANRIPNDDSFLNDVKETIIQFSSRTIGVIVVSGDGQPLHAFTPFSMGARGIMSPLTGDSVIRLVIERASALMSK